MSDAASAGQSTEYRLQQARQGSREALADLIEAYRWQLIHLARQKLACDDALRRKIGCSDLVQETLLKAYRGFAEFRGTEEAELVAWLRRILEREFLQARRDFRQTAKRQIHREVPLDPAASSRFLPHELAVDDTSPSHKLGGLERRQRVAAAVDRLPPHFRQVVVLHVYFQESHRTIAVRLGRTPAAVKQLFLRAMTRLAEELDGEPSRL